MSNTNTDLDTASVLLAVRGIPAIREHAYVVGAWVWVEFRSKPTAETRQQLSDLGFHWNHTRKVWQHSCGVYRRADKSGDPRYRYGMVALGTGVAEEGEVLDA